MDLVVTYRRPLAFFTWWENFHDTFLYVMSYLPIGLNEPVYFMTGMITQNG
jgi:hypothetical protein